MITSDDESDADLYSIFLEAFGGTQEVSHFERLMFCRLQLQRLECRPRVKSISFYGLQAVKYIYEHSREVAYAKPRATTDDL